MKKEIIKLKAPPTIVTAASVVGGREFDGPLGKFFDDHDSTGEFGEKTWERAESEMQRRAVEIALTKAGLLTADIDAVFAGDLINQCIGSAFGLISYNLPFFGLYGACSTAAEGLTLAAMLCSGGIYKKILTVSSSHFCTAERQFRYPIEYGGQRPPTAQWTVTGSGAFILSSEGNGPYITELLPGRSVEKGICDAGNMGAAMAPAVIDTLTRYFDESGLAPKDFDLIVTGDLGSEGSEIVAELMENESFDFDGRLTDCGLLIYDRETEDMHAGGSGCGCSAVVLAAHLLDRIKRGELRDILFIGTGALMNPMSVQQGQSIPGIAHLVRISGRKELPC